VTARLIADGWQILGRNVHVGRSEIDVIAIDLRPPPTLVLVEVRWRAERDFGLPEESVGWRKRSKLRAALGRILEAGQLPDGTPLPMLPVRIDIVAVEPDPGSPDGMRIRHHRSAVGG
jgi:Holliday junction resolvase-like predicted endonuclease